MIVGVGLGVAVGVGDGVSVGVGVGVAVGNPALWAALETFTTGEHIQVAVDAGNLSNTGRPQAK